MCNLWGAYDIEAPDGSKVEVKFADYVQSCYQKEPSKIQFGIRTTFEWTTQENAFGQERKRQSDVYVFSLLAQKYKTQVNPIDVDQWEFYIIPTTVINSEFDDRQSISLRQVKKYSKACKISQLADAIKLG